MHFPAPFDCHRSDELSRVCGANSDLFGRRWFIVGGNAILFVGFILGGAAPNNTAMMAAMALIGFVRNPIEIDTNTS